MRMGLSRRAVLGAGLAAVAAGVAGCTKALRSSPSATGLPSAKAVNTAATAEHPATAGVSSRSAAVSSRSVPSTATSTAHPTSVAATTPTATSPVGHTTKRSTSAARTATRALGPATQIDSGPTRGAQLALTFHGAGDIGLARQILQIAAAKKARITVMVVGTWLEQNPEIASTILAAGHELGNHTWSHQNINALPEEQMRQEVVRCRDALIAHAGTPGDYFRQSQSQNATGQMRRVAGAAGYRFCLSYDVDSMDWTDPGGPAVRANLRAARAGSIVSMHLGHQSSVDALPGILDDLAARGLRAVTVSSLLHR
ncbi:MAG: polysaccharide deacetylase family protein [Nakamurella sp.]